MRQCKDITGQRFGRLVALYKQPWKKGGHSVWHCICDCGNETDAELNQLTAKNIKHTKRSCGCLQAEYFKKPNREFVKIDYEKEIGKKYGEITILEICKDKQKDTADLSKEVIGQCSCGNIERYVFKGLKKGQTKQCSQCGRYFSYDVNQIKSILTKKNIPFVMEKLFKETGKHRFDFYINNNYILEYDGSQHFYTKSNWFSKERLEKDLIKNHWCFSNNIPLIRIPYDAKWEEKDLYLETTRYLLTRENEEQYYKERIK